jgi:cytoskeletal protein CcmA (bactofilin family)
MLGIGRREGAVEVKPPVKNVLSQARPGNMPLNTSSTPAGVQRSSHPQASSTSEPVASAVATKEAAPPPSTTVAPVPMPVPVAQANSVAETPGSKLFVGPNIKLKGVEISDCDVLIVEGHVEATVFSKGLQIAQPGTLNGTVAIDIAEIYGSFSGELTARTRLVVHGTGRVSGKIRYGKLIVAEGGELTGDVRQIDGAEDHPQLSLTAATDARTTSNGQARGRETTGTN